MAGLGAIALYRPPAGADNGAGWRITYVGHASFLIQTAGLNILLDPVWSARASPVRFVGPKRVNDPGIAFAALPPIDVVLVSHGHYDHLDVRRLSRLAAAHHPRVITPLGNDTIMRNHDPAIAAEAHDWHDRVEIGARRRGHAGADAALVGAQSVRPQYVAVGVVRDRYAGRADLFRCRFGLRRRPAFPRRPRTSRPIAARHSADRGLRAALVHARSTYESGRVGAGLHRLRRRACARAPPRHVPAHRRNNRRAARRAVRGVEQCRGIPAERFRVLRPGQVWEL